MESELEDNPALLSQLQLLYQAIQAKQGNTTITQINQTHHGSGDNVGGDKKTYNIGKIDKADFH